MSSTSPSTRAESRPTDQNDNRPPDAAALQSGGVPGEHPLGLDYIFDILKNQRRRWVLSYLQEHDGTVTMNDLAEHIAALENDTTPDNLSSRQRKRVYVGLYQCHLPKMDDIDVIEFDKNRGLIELGANAGQLDRYLDTTDETTDRWPVYYLLVSTTGLVLFAGLVVAGVTTASVIPVLLSTFLVAIAALAVAHHTR